QWGHSHNSGPSLHDDEARPLIARKIESAGRVAAIMANRYIGLEARFKNSDVQRIIDDTLTGIDPGDCSRFEIPNFSKMIFYGLATTYLRTARSHALRVPEIEERVNLVIQRECLGFPCIVCEDIDFYEATKIAQLVLDCLQTAGCPPDEIIFIEKEFSGL